LFELGLLPAMQWLVEEIRRLYGIVVNLRDDGRGKALDHALRSVVFRCVRELLINVAKHAKVGAAEVALATESESLVIAVSDHGIGFDASEIDRTISGGGFGLVSIRERINHLGGDVKVESGPQGGTTITLTVPLSVPEQQPQTGAA
jgi:signal transduction histidine kinase